jgi:hypothetical protein
MDNQANLIASYQVLVDRVEKLERIIDLVLNNYRETAIMNVGAIEEALGKKRTMPNRKERNRIYQQKKAKGQL